MTHLSTFKLLNFFELVKLQKLRFSNSWHYLVEQLATSWQKVIEIANVGLLLSNIESNPPKCIIRIILNPYWDYLDSFFTAQLVTLAGRRSQAGRPPVPVGAGPLRRRDSLPTDSGKRL